MNGSFLHFSEDYIELSLTPGEVREGSFMLFGDVSRPLKGYVTSNDLKMNCLVTELDPEGCRIPYVFDGNGMQLGDSIEGSFSIITNQGETSFKYQVTIVSPSPITSMGQIDNLYQFIKLARKNWIEASTFFTSQYFQNVLENESQQAICLYKGLKKSTDASLALEEFLIGMGKKSPVAFEAETEQINLVSALDISQEKISILKEGWGYCQLKVSVDGTFLSVLKDRIDYDDYLGNRCTLEIDIDPSKLHAGRNFGCVRFDNEYVHIEIPVCIVNVRELTLSHNNKSRDNVVRGIKKYIDYNLGKMDYDQFARGFHSILSDSVGRRDQNGIRDLIRAHFLFEEGKYNEGRFLLKNSEKILDFDKEEDAIHCYFKYLGWLADKSNEKWRRVYDEIRSVLAKNPGNWRVAWLVISMNKERPTGSESWRILEECYKRGCRSPLIYLEGLKFLEENTGRMTTPSEFIIQLLHFAVKNDYLTDDMIFQIHYLAGRIKKYDPIVERILKKCFEIKNDDESLFALCIHIMRGKVIKPEYLKIYEEAIDRQLRVGGIYDAYMEAAMEADLDQIHENAIRYLFYQDKLSVEKRAFLYSRIVGLETKKHEIYQLFKRDMIEFSVEQFEEGSINRDFAILYKHFLRGVYVRPENIIRFMTIFSCHEISLKSGSEDRIVVVSSVYENETMYTLTEGKRYVPIWGRDSCVLLMSKDGKIYRSQDRLECKPLFTKDEILSVISRLESDISEVLMDLFHVPDEEFHIDNKNYEVIANICASRKLAAFAETKITMHLVRFYASEEMKEELEKLLLALSPDVFSQGMRSELISVMCWRGLYERAFQWMTRAGIDGVSPYNLTAVCHHLIKHHENVPTDLLIKLVYKVYQMGYYTKRMLVYLAKYFNGSCNDMWKLKQACQGFLVKSHELDERLIRRITHTGKHLEDSTEILLSYMSDGGHTKVVISYLAVRCQAAFRNNEDLPAELINAIRRLYAEGLDLPDDIQLETLKTLAGQETIHQGDSYMITHMIETFIFGREIFFDFFRQFVDLCPIVELYQDKTVLEFTSQNSDKVILHYVEKREGDMEAAGEPVYVACEMEKGYNGTFTKEFILFFGDRVDYYITEGDIQGGRLAAQGSLVCTDTSIENKNSRYGLINSINRAVSLGNIEEAEALYDSYEEREKYSDGLFTLI